MKPYKITQAEADAIRDVAHRSTGANRIKLQPGIRVCLAQDVEDVNILLLPQNDDLADWMSWSVFRQGFNLTADGRGLIDIYVYGVGEDTDLKTNVKAVFEGGRLVRVDGSDPRSGGNVSAMWSL